MIDVSKYFKTFRDDYGFLYAIETVGDERELIKEIRKQNEQLQQLEESLGSANERINKYQQCIDEVESICNAIVNGTHFTADVEAQLKELAKLALQRIEEEKK